MAISRFIKRIGYCLIPIFFLVSGCLQEDSGLLYRCGNTLLSEQFSPQRTLILSRYERDCGATTDFVTIVSIRQRNQLFKHDSNATIAVAKGKLSLDFEWVSETRVKIKSSGELFRKENRFSDVDITYEQVLK
ncbi:MAG: hypothetical protein LH702_36040 [Phormidesmis sp. CAN_BIN44]|nr:hypothetical protein [Phormidesmis sp. CAN_BIN44]